MIALAGVLAGPGALIMGGEGENAARSKCPLAGGKRIGLGDTGGCRFFHSQLRKNFLPELFGGKILSVGVDFSWQSRFRYTYHLVNWDTSFQLGIPALIPRWSSWPISPM
jgi:hypothetical protein